MRPRLELALWVERKVRIRARVPPRSVLLESELGTLDVDEEAG